MVLQRAHVISILKHVAVVSEGFSKLGVISRGPPLSLFDMLLGGFPKLAVLSRGPPLSLFDMLLATGGGSRT